MKRMWIGIGLLLVIFAAALWLWLGLGGVFGRISDSLDRAAEAAAARDWAAAEENARAATQAWNTYRKIAASFTDHEPLEDMDALFRELAIYSRDKLSTEYAVVCVHLSRLAEAVEEALSLRWWSLL